MSHRACVRTLVLAAVLAPAAAIAQGAKPAPASPAPIDTAHAVIQQRGAEGAGAYQEASAQVFEQLPNGGVIELQRAYADSVGMRAVRTRLRAIAQAFATGDFAAPSSMNVSSVPGARVMWDRRNAIRFDYRDLARGGALRISTSDRTAQKAIWDFIAYQRNEHMAEP